MINPCHLVNVAAFEAEQAPAITNPAVARCVQAWKAARLNSLADGKTDFYAGIDATFAYRAALPPLSGQRNIADFIACIGYALAIQIIRADSGASLLAAAKAAHSTRPQRPTNSLPKQAKKPASAAV